MLRVDTALNFLTQSSPYLKAQLSGVALQLPGEEGQWEPRWGWQGLRFVYHYTFCSTPQVAVFFLP